VALQDRVDDLFLALSKVSESEVLLESFASSADAAHLEFLTLI
jgi:hypothetical protein